MRILVDMDGVLADADEAFYRTWEERFSHLPSIPFAERTQFYAEEEFPEESRAAARSIRDLHTHYSFLEPIPGGKRALETLCQLGHEVFICTSPNLSNYPMCVLGKYLWVDRHLGADWVRKLILTKDKTLVDGDILIDDKPVITGVARPRWEQILYDQPYNRSITDKRRLTWDTWEEILL